MNKFRIKNIRFLLTLFITLAGTATISFGQGSELTVKGTVISSVDSKPLVGINVRIGSFSSAISDESGKFSITVPDGGATLTFSG